MDNLNDLKEIWLTADPNDLPAADKIVKTIRSYRLKHAIKKAALIFLTLLLVATMCWVLFAYKSNLLVTRIGEACMFIAMFILLSANANSLRRISNLKDCSNDEFVNFLKREKIKHTFFQKRTQLVGFAFASVGLLLYLFEGVYTTPIQMIMAYLLASLWIFICWFVIRPRSIKRKNRELTETIQNLERLSAQLSNN